MTRSARPRGEPSTAHLLALVLALACTSTAGQPEAPEPAAPPPTPPRALPAATAPRPPTVEASPLHLVALREGSIELSRLDDTPVAVLEGEPVPIIDGVPSRSDDAGRGLPAFGGYDSEIHTLALGGSLEPSGTAWVTTWQEYDRAGSLHRVHRRSARGWEPLDLRRGLLAAYHLAYVQRDGALFALRTWDRDPEQDHFEPEDDGPEARAHRRALDRARGKARPDFVRLSGPEVAAPMLSLRTPHSAAQADDGTIYALAQLDVDGTNTDVLLVWPPGSTRAEQVRLPDWHGSDPRLSINGDVAMVLGANDEHGPAEQSYLAIGRGTAWERVPVSLPGRPPGAPARVVGAAQTPSGELWLAVGDRWHAEPGDLPVWRKPRDGAWQAVPLPTFGDDLFGRGPGVVYDVTEVEPRGWSTIERPSLAGVTPQATALAWIDGAVWVVLELEHAYELASDMATRRAVLLSTRPTPTAAPARLPARWELYVERHNLRAGRGTPGKGACQRAAFVLGPASLLETRPELVDAVRKATSKDELPPQPIYVGRLDGEQVLVISASAESPAEAKAFADVVTRATGATPTIECRVPTLVRMVAPP